MASFSELEELPCGHVDLVKPWDRDHPAYVLIAQFLRDVENTMSTATGEKALRELTYRLRRVSLDGRWVQREEERIRLEEELDKPGSLRCQVRNRRWGGLARRRFTICIYLTDHRPDEDIDLSWEIGSGQLGTTEFGEIGRRLRGVFDVETISARQRGTEFEYRALPPIEEPGWLQMSFEAPAELEEGVLYDLLEIQFSTVVDRRQGWYLYQLERTVAEKLEVLFEAPFKAPYINFLGRDAKFSEPTPAGNSFLHRVSVDVPLPIGRSVVWMFPKEK